MSSRFHSLSILSLSIFLLAVAHVQGQQIEARISSDEPFVGAPIHLQIRINNVEKYQLPEPPSIEGCKSAMLGTPSQSSQITIINGRRSESRSVSAIYSFTPQRAGKFVIPEMKIEIEGEIRTLQPYNFTAKKSETGDLMYVEIKSEQTSVYVGQPLKMTLKVLIKPFQDKNRKVILNEGDMWQLVSDNTAWGLFSDRMGEMSENRTRPNSRQVLRKDDKGQESVYYEYQVDATIYPNRPGRIEGKDVQIVVNYPTQLGRARDPFRDVFGDSVFGQSTLADDFFSSRFSRRLSISKSRPIVASATVDPTDVLSLPHEGRPADYRGAVGSYQIASEAEPLNVSAGDPITLRMAIFGDGPMQLIQAPPLSEISSIASDFKTAEQTLAGFVQNNTKIFATTIRPRREGIHSIPRIPFSFFDPKLEKYKTVYSDPIDIVVSSAEELSLDSIVGNSLNRPGTNDSPLSSISTNTNGPDFSNDFSEAVLASVPTEPTRSPWWLWLLLPPVLLLIAVAFKITATLPTLLSYWRSPKTLAKNEIASASEAEFLQLALLQFIGRRFRMDERPSPTSTLGILRSNGLSDLANEAEAFYDKTGMFRFGNQPQDSIQQQKKYCLELVRKIDAAHQSRVKIKIRNGTGGSMLRFISSKRLVLYWVIFAFHFVLQNQLHAFESIPLTDSQATELFRSANRLYQTAGDNDQEELRTALYFKSASKYKLLVDAGIENANLYLNLGNAQYKSNQFGHAIASYLAGHKLEPSHPKIRRNLQFVRDKVAQNNKQNDRAALASGDWGFRQLNMRIISWLGWTTIFGSAMLSSLCFWGVIAARILNVKVPAFVTLAISSGLVLGLCATSLSIAEQQIETEIVVVVVSDFDLRAGDGEEFPLVQTLNGAEGMELDILAERQGWIQVKTPAGETGWVIDSIIRRV